MSSPAFSVQAYFDEKVDIHHIFPKRLEARPYDCIVNETPLYAKTNRLIGGNAPSAYLAAVQKKAGIDSPRMDEILRTHVIDSAFLRADDFAAFFVAREPARPARARRSHRAAHRGRLRAADRPPMRHSPPGTATRLRGRDADRRGTPLLIPHERRAP